MIQFKKSGSLSIQLPWKLKSKKRMLIQNLKLYQAKFSNFGINMTFLKFYREEVVNQMNTYIATLFRKGTTQYSVFADNS